MPLIPVAPQPGDAFPASQQRAGRSGPKRADCLGADDRELAEEELAADLHFIRLGRAVFRGPALHHVTNVNILALERYAFTLGRALDHLCEQLARTPDKREALHVFIGTRAFSHEDQARLRVSGTEHDAVPPGVQAAAFAIAYIFANSWQSVFFGSQTRQRLGSRNRFNLQRLRNRLGPDGRPGGLDHGRLAAIDRCESQVPVEAQVLPQLLSVHGQAPPARGAVSEPRPGFGPQSRAWRHGAEAGIRRSAAPAKPHSGRCRSLHRYGLPNWPRSCRNSWFGACAGLRVPSSRFRLQIRSAANRPFSAQARPEYPA